MSRFESASGTKSSVFALLDLEDVYATVGAIAGEYPATIYEAEDGVSLPVVLTEVRPVCTEEAKAAKILKARSR